jgi:hypothetical protein
MEEKRMKIKTGTNPIQEERKEMTKWFFRRRKDK